jgi:LacI family transcriptional regulator
MYIGNCTDTVPTWFTMNLDEIAALAKVSTATVSRAVRRVPSVDPILARRVWRVVEQVGYYPNTQARALVSGRSRVFGLIVSEISNPFFSEIVQTFVQLGIRHNYEVLLASIPEDSSEFEMAARRMIERRVDGVAILTFGRSDSLVEIFANRKVPVFVIDSGSPARLVKTARVDYEHGIRQAVQHLAALGHVQIGFVSGPEHLKTAEMRKIAFQQCMNEIGLETPAELLAHGDHTMEAGMKAMSSLGALPNRPSAVVCSNDLTAIGVMRQAFELSLDVPRDLSVVGFDDIRLAQFLIPPLTTVRMSQTEIADTAFTRLLECAEGERAQSSPEVGVIKTSLVLRRSTALAPHRRMKTAARTDEQFATERGRERNESPSTFGIPGG